MSATATILTAPPGTWTSPPTPLLRKRPRARLFGHFLVEQGVLAAEALDEALALMNASNATVGELAVARGLMTNAEADEVNRLQRHVDGRFGELAILLGIGGMTPQHLDALCWEQESTNIRLSDALVELGYINPTELEDWLREFQTCEASQPDPVDTLPEVLRASQSALLALESLPRLAQRVLRTPARIGAATPWHGRHHRTHAAGTLGGRSPLGVGLSFDERCGDALSPLADDDDPQSGVCRFTRLLCALIDSRINGTASTLSEPVPGELPKSAWEFDLALGQGTGVLLLTVPSAYEASDGHSNR